MELSDYGGRNMTTENIEVGQYVKVTLPDTEKNTREWSPPYYSGVGELVDIQKWNDNRIMHCVQFPQKGYV